MVKTHFKITIFILTCSLALIGACKKFDNNLESTINSAIFPGPHWVYFRSNMTGYNVDNTTIMTEVEPGVWTRFITVTPELAWLITPPGGSFNFTITDQLNGWGSTNYTVGDNDHPAGNPITPRFEGMGDIGENDIYVLFQNLGQTIKVIFYEEDFTYIITDDLQEGPGPTLLPTSTTTSYSTQISEFLYDEVFSGQTLQIINSASITQENYNFNTGNNALAIVLQAQAGSIPTVAYYFNSDQSSENLSIFDSISLSCRTGGPAYAFNLEIALRDNSGTISSFIPLTGLTGTYTDFEFPLSSFVGIDLSTVTGMVFRTDTPGDWDWTSWHADTIFVEGILPTTTTTITFTTVTSSTTTETTTTIAPLSDGVMLIGGSASDLINGFGSSQTDADDFSIIQTSDGGYILAGRSTSSDVDLNGEGTHGNYDILLAKLTVNGHFDNSFGGNGIVLLGGSSSDEPSSIIQTMDGGFIIVGRTLSSDGDMAGQGYHGSFGYDIFIIKLTPSGIFDTSFDGDGIRLIGGSSEDTGHSIVQSSDSGFVITGHTRSSDGDMIGQGLHRTFTNDILVTKLTSSGAFDTTFGGDGILLIGGTLPDQGYSIIQTKDNGYLVVGNCTSQDGDFLGQGVDLSSDIVAIKLDNLGNFAPFFGNNGIKIIGGTGLDNVGSVRQSADDGYIFTGISQSNDGDMAGEINQGNTDIVVIKLLSDGNLDSTFDGDGVKLIGGSSIDVGTSIIQNTVGNYILSCYTQSSDGNFPDAQEGSLADGCIIELTPNGQFGNNIDLDGIVLIAGSSNDLITSMSQTQDDGYISIGSTFSTDGLFANQFHHGNSDIAVVKLNADGLF